MREFCKILRGLVDEGKSDDEISSTVSQMTEQVYTIYYTYCWLIDSFMYYVCCTNDTQMQNYRETKTNIKSITSAK